jgi:acetylornithine deacetylase
MAHSAYPHLGESAIEKLLDVLADIRSNEWPADEVFGETTCNIGVLAGGSRANVIPAEAEATLHIRLAKDSAGVRDLLEQAIGGRATMDYKSVHDPVRLMTIAGFDQMLAAGHFSRCAAEGDLHDRETRGIGSTPPDG